MISSFRMLILKHLILIGFYVRRKNKGLISLTWRKEIPATMRVILNGEHA